MRWLPALASFSFILMASSCVSWRRGPLAPIRSPIVHVPSSGRAFQALPTRDGSWIFASLTVPDAGSPGIAVYRRTHTGLSFVRLVPIDDPPTGMILTHDEKLLVVAAGNRLAFLDVARLTGGADVAVLGYLDEHKKGLGRIYVNVTYDDQFLFASDERARTITVINLAMARASGFSPSSIVGKIPVGNAPIDLAFSPDEKHLYTTSQSMPRKMRWPLACRREGASADSPPDHSNGAILIVDVERAKTDPENSVAGIVAAGCSPVRLVLSPKGDVAYVSARGMDALLAFDTKKLLTDPDHALVGQVPVGPSPVGVALFDSGRRAVVTSSNRFSGGEGDRQSLFVIDTSRVAEGAAAVLGTIPAGAFPRELRVTADGHTLLLTNFASKTLQVIDLTQVTLFPAK